MQRWRETDSEDEPCSVGKEEMKEGVNPEEKGIQGRLHGRGGL